MTVAAVAQNVKSTGGALDVNGVAHEKIEQPAAAQDDRPCRSCRAPC
jgi:hypothetical protein